MKLEDLTKLGIAEDIAKQVVSLSEQELNAEKSKLTDKEAELTMASAKITELSDTVKKFDGVDVDKLKADLAASEQKYADDISALKLDNALSVALADSGAKDKDIVKGLIDKSILKLGNDGKLVGFSEQFDKLKADKAFLFNEPSAEGARIDTGLDHSKAADNISDAQARAVMGLPAAK